MGLLEYGRLLAQRGWIIALCIALLCGGAYLYSARQTRIYRSTQIMLVQPDRADANVAQSNLRQLNGYVVYLFSSKIAEEIAKALGLGISGAELKGRAEISANPDLSIIQIDVNDTDGETANRIAFAWGQKLVQYRQALNENLPEGERISAVAQDFPIYIQYRPRLIINLALAGTVGLLLGGLIVFVLEFRKNSVIRHPEDLENGNGDSDSPALAVLVAIPGD